jgi:hypothetical protein
MNQGKVFIPSVNFALQLIIAIDNLWMKTVKVTCIYDLEIMTMNQNLIKNLIILNVDQKLLEIDNIKELLLVDAH